MSVDESARQSLLSRRQLLKTAGALTAAGGLGAAYRLRGLAAQSPPAPTVQAPAVAVRRFRTRPDLRPAATAAAGAGAAGGYLILGPGAVHKSQPGPLIVDDRGEPVWFRPVTRGGWATNVSVQHYRGAPVLTWWEGTVDGQGYGHGEAVILDRTYHEIARISGGRGRDIDMHELLLTPEGTLLVTCAPQVVPADLSSLGGPRDGTVFQSVLQEIEVHTGRLVSEWRSLDHVPVAESYRPLGGVLDYLHVNSIAVLPDRHLLVSGRNTWALYKLDRRSGEVIWRLGGKASDFHLGPGVQFAWQHDARRREPGVITVFDDGSDGITNTESQSRALKLAVDTARRTVTLETAYVHPDRLLASSMGNVQLLPDGHAVVGWGSEPYVSEFAADGTLLADLRMVSGQQSYRGYRLSWSGQPSDDPAIAVVQHAGSGARTLYASWNGATEIAAWQVLHAGGRTRPVRPVGVAASRGFETGIALGATGGYVAVAPLDASGRRLGRSRTVAL